MPHLLSSFHPVNHFPNALLVYQSDFMICRVNLIFKTSDLELIENI